MSVTVAPAAPKADPCASAEAHWKAADSIGTAAAFEDHLARFSNCSFASLAKGRIETLKQKVVLAPAAGDSKTFDGKWDVTISCTNSGKALGYTRSLSATVTNGALHAEDLEPRTNNTLAIDGQIPADGKTTLSARGMTGPSAYTVNNAVPGSPYAYTIDAQFERTRGSGKRNELRPCSFTFVKR